MKKYMFENINDIKSKKLYRFNKKIQKEYINKK